MAQKFQTLPGFRDFYPADCTARNYLFGQWRAVAKTYGFVEYDGPVLEPTDLYKRKSGEEIANQLFCFTDKGEREVSMRPELTPSLARMAAARQREFKKPLKWFSIGQFFRYEKQQKGRLREFYQFNCDILGEASPAADAELIALSIDLMCELGFTAEDFAIKLSDRTAWSIFIEQEGLNAEKTDAFLQVIDKLERDSEEKTDAKLAELGTSLAAVKTFINSGIAEEKCESLQQILAELDARGMRDFVRIDLSIVRGLAYYSGPVFEVFDIGKGMRAIAGGGRYDQLVKLIGGVDMPAAGFAMGDVVVTDLIRETESANQLLEESIAEETIDAYVVIADEAQRREGLQIVQRLRESGLYVNFPLVAVKVNKQFQSAEQQNADLAIIVGTDYPQIAIKVLSKREELNCEQSELEDKVSELLLSL
ncbi:MAG: histidine--tRNA ligase [Verrucomicrobiales bacterium]|nr:histidine--tRNA ligase [Verrucomicrobiales bacterium]